MAKVARVKVSKEFLEMFLRADFGIQPNTTIESNAPKDLEVLGLAMPATALRAWFSGYPYTLEVYVRSESFPDVPEACEPPLIEPFVYVMKHG